METGREGIVEILGWEHLKDKERSDVEELLLQSVRKLEPAYWNGVKVMEDSIYGAFSFHEEGNGERQIASAAFLWKGRDFILAVLQDERGIFQQMELAGGQAPFQEMEAEERIEAVFERILKRGQQKVREMEEYLIDMEREIVVGKVSRNRNRTIFECKRLLSVWKNDYRQFLNIVEGINGLEQKKEDAQGHILTEESACYLRVYENKIRRLTEETQFLYEELVHIREALDAALTFEQNRIMKMFTTVSAIFMPLTLIAGWYGMNFSGMPELLWRHGYAFVWILSVFVVLACVWFFKKKDLF
ncbi:MAG: hypothetical protein HFH38_10975 [Lachnospiraceae bacterium]|jgi:magnesium transporter|nr:hypothetical protein [Lachnospiraceae bacterium]